jgi:hypothetical protein
MVMPRVTLHRMISLGTWGLINLRVQTTVQYMEMQLRKTTRLRLKPLRPAGQIKVHRRSVHSSSMTQRARARK